MSKHVHTAGPEPYSDRLEGHIERITFTSADSGYTVARFKASHHHELITIVGNIPRPVPGERVQLEGQWTRHPQFGMQFKVARYRAQAPVTLEGIEKYLGSGAIRGVGPKMAARIVKHFGADTLRVVQEDPQRLADISGIGPHRIRQIKGAWTARQAHHDVMVFLQSHGIGGALAVRMLKQYGPEVVRILQSNPYRLAKEIIGIGFATADRVARSRGIPPDDPHRIAAGLVFVLEKFVAEGHVYAPWAHLMERGRELLGVEDPLLKAALERLVAQKQLVREGLPEGGQAIYLRRFFDYESEVARRLSDLDHHPGLFSSPLIGPALDWAQGQLKIRLAGQQIEAIRTAVRHKVMVITGGPGTGKTTLVQALARIFNALNATLLLTAPTGRAAKRLSEATARPASTVHRLLAFSPKEGGFKKNEHHPLACDALVVDEASMLDLRLMHHLLKALPLHARLVLVGDVHQLPSVGAGNVLRDIIDSRRFAVVRLQEIFRQARTSRIVTNAHRVNAGHLPELKPQGPQDDFFFIAREDPQAALETVLKLVTERIPKRFGFHPAKDVQVLTPMHRGLVGAGNLNRELQAALNPDAPHMMHAGNPLRVGDKVMQVRNNYHKEVFNGDIGRITAIDANRREVSVCFDDQTVTYEACDLEELELAYAISIHKSQGSEYPVVIVPVLTQHYVLLQRNLIYTAMTRGRKLVVLVGTVKALAIALNRHRPGERYSGLARRIRCAG